MAALLLSGAGAAAFAQSAAPGATTLEEILVVAGRDSLADRLRAAPGGATLLLASDLADRGNPTISSALADAPGVVVQDFFGGNDQPRIQIRGSGLQQNPVERGVLMLRDGLPLNRADGSYIVGFANAEEAQAVEIYRGYMANRLGATVLGGAINLVSPTGLGSPGYDLVLRGGSFGLLGASASVGGSSAAGDLLLHADQTRRDGYRSHNDSRRLNLGGNAGLRLLDSVKLRLFFNYAELGFAIPGPLPLAAMGEDPRQVWGGPQVTPTGAMYPGPNVIRDQPRRDSTAVQAGARASGVFGAHVIDVLAGFTHSDDRFRFPMSSGIRATKGNDLALVGRYAWKPDEAASLPLFEATAQYVTGTADRDYFLNLARRSGAQFGANRLSASTFAASAGLNLPLAAFTLSPSISWARAGRSNQDRYAAATRPTAAYNPANPLQPLPGGGVAAADSSYQRHYAAWSPALALSWQPAADQMLFAALNRSFEPPTHDDLFATVNGTPNSSAGRPNPAAPMQPASVFVTPDLRAQTATTLEGGWRAGGAALSLDAVVYYSWVRNELLSLRDESGSSLGAANAPRTRHFGVELGARAKLAPAVSARATYTYQDFRFEDDPLRGNNRLAGAPRHWVHLALDWQVAKPLHVATALRWVPVKTPVDNLNTLYSSPYAVVDLRAHVALTDAALLFVEASNLLDKRYASSTLIVDQARADQAAFLPGDGRALAAGVRMHF